MPIAGRPGLESCLEEVFLKGESSSNGQVLLFLCTKLENISFVKSFARRFARGVDDIVRCTIYRRCWMG